MKKLIWLDDVRDPFKNPDWLVFSPIGKDINIVWCKGYYSFVSEIIEHGLPDGICFDHDLGEYGSGYDCAKFLVDWCIDKNLELPKFSSQSANPVGRENILSLLNNYNKFRNE